MKNFLLVMAGGHGTRFWPESTSKKPKQYLKLVSDKSLLTETLERFTGVVHPENRFIITVKNQETLAKENSIGLVNKEGIILEPMGRNTAPCILLALTSLLKKGASKSDCVVIVPSDHVILNREGYKRVIEKAILAAKNEKKIVTIGITPTFPHTGFGYIEKESADKKEFYSVTAFKEKPSFEKATEYLRSGRYLWNAGMFVATIDTLCEEFKSCSPETYAHFDKLLESVGNFEKVSAVYKEIPANSIDYAVMEKSKRVLVVPSEFDWNDLGSWDALEAVVKSTDRNCVMFDKGHFFDNAKGNIVYAPNKFVSLIDVDDLIVVSNERALLVLPKKEAQKVKRVVEFLQKNDTSLL